MGRKGKLILRVGEVYVCMYGTEVGAPVLLSWGQQTKLVMVRRIDDMVKSLEKKGKDGGIL